MALLEGKSFPNGSILGHPLLVQLEISSLVNGRIFSKTLKILNGIMSRIFCKETRFMPHRPFCL